MRRRSGYGWFELIIGILLIILGIVTFINPSNTLRLIVIFCGLLAMVTGISDIVFYVKTQRYMSLGPTISLVTGVFGIMAGAMLLVYPAVGSLTLVVLVPIWFIAHCISRLSHLAVVRETAGSFYYWFTLIVNILGLVLAFMMIIRPYIAYYTAGFVIGFYLIVIGIDTIVVAVSNMGSRW